MDQKNISTKQTTKKNESSDNVDKINEINQTSSVKQAKEIGLDVNIFGNFELHGSDAVSIVGNLLEGSIIYDLPELDENNLKVKSFMNKYSSNYGKPYSWWDVASRYDTVYLIKDAIGYCKSDKNTVCIKNYLYDMNWYDGLIGKFKFDKNGDVVGIHGVAKKMVNGKSIILP